MIKKRVSSKREALMYNKALYVYLLWPRDYITETGLLKNFLFYAQATSVILEASAKWVEPVPIIKDVCSSPPVLSPSLFASLKMTFPLS